MGHSVAARRRTRGFTFLEILIALLFLSVGLMAVAQGLATALLVNKTAGRDASKATVFAHDKMEELSRLAFTDTTTNVTVNPPYPTNGTGLAAGGTIDPDAPVDGYADYLDDVGVRTTAASAAFTRQWKIVSSATSKQIAASVVSKRSLKYGAAPVTTTVTIKAP